MRIDVRYIVMGRGVIGLPVLNHVMLVLVLELKKEPILLQKGQNSVVVNVYWIRVHGMKDGGILTLIRVISIIYMMSIKIKG